MKQFILANRVHCDFEESAENVSFMPIIFSIAFGGL